ncbi:MAG: tyrosine-type recombinase/integrase [Candidatus Aenigmarchaeota archaeon]|nr:tyrosine-type recombinase/integrase [Candidatus Aenigmarchaeota archaeon]
MPDIHKFERAVKSRIERIKTDKTISEKNREILLKFANDCYSDRLSHGRVYKHLFQLQKIAKLLKKDFPDATKDDIKMVVREIELSHYSENTKKDFRISIKKFYKWLNGGEICPDCARWIKTEIKLNNKKLPEELLTQDEIKQMIKTADNPRDKALIFVLFESGCRIGELITIKMKQVNFDKYGAYMIVNGKTGARRVRLIMSCDYLRYWIESHPNKSDPESLLWVSISTNSKGEEISYACIRKRIAEIAQKAGITKKVNPHSFRHARATYLAGKITELQLCEIMGWTLSSRMPATYVHMSGKAVDDALLKIHGLKQNGDDEFLTCPRCKTENKPIARYCSDCGMPFGIDIIANEEEERDRYDSIMLRLISHPKVKKVIKEVLKEEKK